MSDVMDNAEAMVVAQRAIAREVFQRTVVETLLGSLRKQVEELNGGNVQERIMGSVAEEFIKHVEEFK